MAKSDAERRIIEQLFARGAMQPNADPAAQQGMGNVDYNQMQAEIQQQEGDKMHPAEAISQITQKLKAGPSGSGYYEASAPAQDPIGKLFGMNTTSRVPAQNYFDTLINTLGSEASARAILPGNTPVGPDGRPHVDENTLSKLDQFVKIPRTSWMDKPSMATGKLALSKLESTYGKDSAIYQNAKDAIDEMGGLPLSKLNEFVSSSMEEKTPNFVKGGNGLYQRYDRATQSYQTVPGQTTGVLEQLGDPASAKMFDTKLQDFRVDPVVKGLRTTLDTLSQASAQLESNNPASIGTFYSIIAKGVGKDAGALAEGDVDRAMGGLGYGERLMRFYNKKIDVFRGKSQFSDGDLKDFRGLLEDLGKSADARYQMNLDRHVNSTLKTIPGLTKDFVNGAFDVSNRYVPGEQRRLKGEATNQPKPSSGGVTSSGVKYKVIK